MSPLDEGRRADTRRNRCARRLSTRQPAALELRGVCKGYGSGASRSEVLHELDLRVEPGEFVAIVGFSGSGKTTLVSLLAGLLRADSGEVLKNGRAITAPGPDRGVVFQSYSLMPWLTCARTSRSPSTASSPATARPSAPRA